MLNYSFEFPLSTTSSVNDVLSLAFDWIEGSPHTKIPRGTLRDVSIGDSQDHTFGNEKVTIAMAQSGESSVGGLRHTRIEGRGLEWVATLVLNKSLEEFLLSLQITCQALNTAVQLPPPKKPFFIQQVLSTIGGGDDGQIPITDQPFVLSAGEEDAAADLMQGTAKNRLPLVYVSANFANKYDVDAKSLARHLSGMAHVVVEPHRDFSLSLKRKVDSRNVFGGTIGTYWPESTARNAYYLSEENPTRKALESRISRDIRLALINRRPRSNCTWSHLSEALARSKYEDLKRRGSTELAEYVVTFDADRIANDAKLLEAEAEIARLNSEMRRLSSRQSPNQRFLIASGKEQDLYEKEIVDTVLEALTSALKGCGDGSRRQHILSDLIDANALSNQREELRSQIKKIFHDYRDMDGKTRNVLTRLGFNLSEEGKHWKAVFQGDGRYTFTFSKTASDHRSGKNTASDVNKILFG